MTSPKRIDISVAIASAERSILPMTFDWMPTQFVTWRAWSPDLRKQEMRFTLALMVHLQSATVPQGPFG